MGITKNAINNLIKSAARMATEQGHRWTEMREAVFACALDQDKPVTAYQIIELLSKKQKKDIKPASVYRSLDALCELGLIVKIESLNAFVVCAHPDHHHQHIFLICKECGTADELEDHMIGKKLSSDAHQHGFKIDRHILELQGVCKSCHM
jgi:Fur family zinc uptake transcriptional regulator